jgi:secondary thiamine-phosphate synthase enzyme
MVDQIEISTPTRSALVEVTAQVQRLVSRTGVKEGVCYIFVPHTTAGLIINENADPTVQSDMLREFERMVPWNNDYAHLEGNSAAHIKSGIVGQSQFVFISGGKLKLGTWQGIYLAEFDGPRTRKLWVNVIRAE